MTVRTAAEAANLLVDNGANPSGTSFQTSVKAPYEVLVGLFGRPEAFGDGKSQVQWVILTPHGITTIYDWKIAENYMDNMDWHIGAKDSVAADFLAVFIQNWVNWSFR